MAIEVTVQVDRARLHCRLVTRGWPVVQPLPVHVFTFKIFSQKIGLKNWSFRLNLLLKTGSWHWFLRIFLPKIGENR
jgi:hypothetical protein